MRLALFLSVTLLSRLTAPGVVLVSTGDPTVNTTAPVGILSDSGWQWQGHWGGVLGTAIAPNHFITAKHVGGSVGQTFSLGGVAYTTTAAIPSPVSDLQIWRIDGTFPSYAPLYTGADEIARDLVVFGRGTQRGNEVNIAGGIGGDLKGWLNGGADGVQRWGVNTVASVFNGGAGFGELLFASFDLASGGNEAHLTSGDSGGGVFIQDAGQWKLAGINYAVDGPFSLTAGGTTFNAALFDMGGLFRANTEIPDLVTDHPSGFYATRISAHQDWILAAVPEPGLSPTLAAGVLAVFAAQRLRDARKRSKNA